MTHKKMSSTTEDNQQIDSNLDHPNSNNINNTQLQTLSHNSNTNSSHSETGQHQAKDTKQSNNFDSTLPSRDGMFNYF